jgi:UDP-N-acetylglucosamine--N-acetylmuramyl-(pentapeptide) pyrophosphoryl-undecaprenol N-acetylglucosamine transferase
VNDSSARSSAVEANVRLAVAGGGTGGHIFPGIAIAREAQLRWPQAEILFIGTGRGLESLVVPREGFRLKTISASGLKGKQGIALWKGLLALPSGLLDSWHILRQFAPDVVIGVGGYASGPPVLAAAMMGIPTLLQEQNAFPGATNRIMKRFVRRVATAFPECERYFGKKAVLTGNPVRQGFVGQSTRLGNGPFRVLIFGGSQGARAINQAVQEALPDLENHLPSLHFVHQTGEKDYSRTWEGYRQAGAKADVRPFFEDMPDQFENADLIICRAGATTIAELTAAGKAAILVPFPQAADNHQQRNAESLSRVGAAEMILQKDLTGPGLAGRIGYYRDHPEKLAQMREMSRSLGRPEAARRIVDLIEELIHV